MILIELQKLEYFFDEIVCLCVVCAGRGTVSCGVGWKGGAGEREGGERRAKREEEGEAIQQGDQRLVKFICLY